MKYKIYESFLDFIYGLGVGYELLNTQKDSRGVLVAVPSSRLHLMEKLQDYMHWVPGAFTIPRMQDECLEVAGGFTADIRTYFFPREGVRWLVENKQQAIKDGNRWGFIHENSGYYTGEDHE